MALLLAEITEVDSQFSQLSTVVSSTLLGLVSPVLLRDDIDIADACGHASRSPAFTRVYGLWTFWNNSKNLRIQGTFLSLVPQPRRSMTHCNFWRCSCYWILPALFQSQEEFSVAAEHFYTFQHWTRTSVISGSLALIYVIHTLLRHTRVHRPIQGSGRVCQTLSNKVELGTVHKA